MARRAAVIEVEAEAVEDSEDIAGVEVIEEIPVADIVQVEFDEEACRQRAYELSESEHTGTPEENWLRAEAELRGA